MNKRHSPFCEARLLVILRPGTAFPRVVEIRLRLFLRGCLLSKSNSAFLVPKIRIGVGFQREGILRKVWREKIPVVGIL